VNKKVKLDYILEMLVNNLVMLDYMKEKLDYNLVMLVNNLEMLVNMQVKLDYNLEMLVNNLEKLDYNLEKLDYMKEMLDYNLEMLDYIQVMLVKMMLENQVLVKKLHHNLVNLEKEKKNHHVNHKVFLKEMNPMLELKKTNVEFDFQKEFDYHLHNNTLHLVDDHNSCNHQELEYQQHEKAFFHLNKLQNNQNHQELIDPK